MMAAAIFKWAILDTRLWRGYRRTMGLSASISCMLLAMLVRKSSLASRESISSRISAGISPPDQQRPLGGLGFL